MPTFLFQFFTYLWSVYYLPIIKSLTQTFTTYSLLCSVPSEDHKIYYWQNMKELYPALDEVMKDFVSKKIISWQHFQKLKWRKSDQCYGSSSSVAPTGGCINWSYEHLEKTFTLYLLDKSFHYHVWDNKKGGPIQQITELPAHPRGYIFHYSSTIFGDRMKLKADKSIDWYNRITDFRMQIQYYHGQFSNFGVNQMIDITFRESFLTEQERDDFVRRIFEKLYGKYLYKRNGIEHCGFTQTYYQAYTVDNHVLGKWIQIEGEAMTPS